MQIYLAGKKSSTVEGECLREIAQALINLFPHLGKEISYSTMLY